MTRTVLLVGARRPAVEAATRLGLRACVLAEPGVTRTLRARAAGLAEVDFDAGEAAIVAAARAALGGAKPRAVVPVAERAVVPAAVVRAALEVPGQPPDDARASRSKRHMKARFIAAGLPCRPIHPVADVDEAEALAARLGWPVVVKALESSGSRGTVIARDAAQVRAAVADLLATRNAGGAGLEAYIEGPEVSVESFVRGGRVLATNLTEYVLPGRANLLPAPLSEHAAVTLLDLNDRVVAAVGAGDGICHAEFYLAPEGPLVGEIAARAPGGHLMELLGRAYAFDAWACCLRLAVDGDDGALPGPARRVVGNLFFHPGEGTVTAIEGWREVRRLPGVVEARLTVRVGERVDARVGTGQSVGHVTVEGDDPVRVRDALRRADAALRITVAPVTPQHP